MKTDSILLPYQTRWIEDDSKVKICEKSRRIGLTWAEAFDCVLTAAAQKGMDVFYIGYNKELALEFIETCASFSKGLDYIISEIEEDETIFKDDEGKSILVYTIRFASGYKISALSSRPANLRGRQGKVVIDEAAFHDQLEELRKAAMAFLMWGGEVCIISTHDGVDNAFNEQIKDTLSGKTGWSHHKITLQDALDDGLYRRICERTGVKYTEEGERKWKEELYQFYGEGAAEELDCIPSKSGGSWLSYAILENNQDKEVKVIKYLQTDEFGKLKPKERKLLVETWFKENLNDCLNQFNPNLRTYAGFDFARSGDGSDLWVAQKNEFMKLESKFILEIRNLPFKDQEHLLDLIYSTVPNFSCAAMDATGNGASVAEGLADTYGSKIIQQKMTAKWYEQEMPALKTRLQDQDLSIPKHKDVFDDFRLIKLVNGVPHLGNKRIKGSDGKMRHGDSAIAAGLLVQASKQEPVDFEYTAVGANRDIEGLDEYNEYWR